MTRQLRPRPRWVAWASAALCAACLSIDRPPALKRRWLLEASRPQVLPPAAAGHLVVPAFHVPAAWAGPGFTHRLPGGEVEVDFHAELFVPPGVALADSTRRWLLGAGLFADVSGETSRLPPTAWLEADVLELSVDESQPGAPAAVLELHFVLLDDQRGIVHHARIGRRMPLPSTAPDAVVAAWNAGLAEVLGEVEAELRQRLQG